MNARIAGLGIAVLASMTIAGGGCGKGRRDDGPVESRVSALTGTADLTFRITGVRVGRGAETEGVIYIGMDTNWDVHPPAVMFPCGTGLGPTFSVRVPCQNEFQRYPDYLETNESMAEVFETALTHAEGYKRRKTVNLATGNTTLDVHLDLSPSSYFVSTEPSFSLSIDPVTGAFQPISPHLPACGFRHNGGYTSSTCTEECGSFPDPPCTEECVILDLGWEVCYTVETVVHACVPTGIPDINCDGVDDDCDGTPDQGFGTKTSVCGPPGACAGLVTLTCQNGHVVSGDCEGISAPAPFDPCNGIDDDCDGAVDEDFGAQTTVCGPPGACAGTVTTSCVGGHIQTGSCTGISAPTTELPDGVDNDCDGRIDECDPGQTDFWCCPATGRTLTVNVSIMNDEVDPQVVNPQEEAFCLPGPQPATACTLRGAFRLAEMLRFTTCDVAATLPAGTYSVTDELMLNGGRLTLTGGTTDARATIIQGGLARRLISLRPGAGVPRPTTFGASNLTLTRGRSEIQNGGGILATASTVRLDNVVVSSNQSNQPGAGMAAFDSNVTIFDSVFNDNQVDNFNTSGGVTSLAGGVFVNGGTAVIERSAIVNNRASKGAGLTFARGHLELRNSTISGNQAYVWGGGIATADEAILEFNTIAGNHVGTGTNDFRAGGGIVVLAGSRLTALGNVIAGNDMIDIGQVRPGDGLSPDCHFHGPTPTAPTPPIVVAAASNLIGAGGDDCLPLGDPAPDPLIGTRASPVNARLNPLPALDASGSAGQVLSLMTASPAIGASQPPATCPIDDQRRFLRPATACSLGAYEANGTANPDGDGIADNVDTLPAVFSSDFSDVGLFGVTTGRIVDRGGHVVTVSDGAGLADGVIVTVRVGGGSAPVQISACNGTVQLSIPPGQTRTVACPRPTSCVFAGQTFTLFDRGRVTSDLFAGSFSFNIDARLQGSARSLGNGFLGDRATITGDATLHGVMQGNRAGVLGRLTERANVASQVPLARTTSGGTGSLVVASGTTRTLSPGAQGAVIVRSGATLALASTGTYRFASLVFEPDTRLNVLGTGTQVVVAVDGDLTLGDRLRMGTGTTTVLQSGQVLFYTNGQNVLYGHDTVVLGSLEARLARVEVQDRGAVTGCLAGRTVIVGQDVNVRAP